MSEKITIEIDAEDNTKNTINKIVSDVKELEEQTKKTGLVGGQVSKKQASAWTEFRSVYSTVLDVVRAGQAVFDATVTPTIELANNVRQMRDVTGQSAEEASRLIQVLDDYKVSVGDAEKATKKFSKDGVEFNIGTIAQLSDQYLALGSDVERTTFLYDKFGKSGENFVEVMKKGSKAILEANNSIDKNLVLTDKQLKQAREYEKNVDNMNDSILALKVSIGNKLLPVISDGILIYQRANEIVQEGNVTYGSAAVAAATLEIKLQREVEAQNEVYAARMNGIASLYGTAEAAIEAGDSLEELSTKNSSLVSGAIALTKGNNDYQESQQGIIEKINTLKSEAASFYPWEAQKIEENRKKIEELGDEYVKNQEKFTSAMQERFALMAIEKIAMSDGIAGYSESELAKAQAILQTADIATAAAFEEQQAMEILTSAVADGKIGVEEYGSVLNSVMADGVISIAEVSSALAGIPTEKNVSINVSTNYDAYDLSSLSSSESGQIRARAGGGTVAAGQTYRVSEMGVPEILTMGRSQYLMMPPEQSGTVTPISSYGRSGNGAGVTINLSYSPALSIGSDSEIKSRLIPLIIQGVQEAKVQGKIQ